MRTKIALLISFSVFAVLYGYSNPENVCPVNVALTTQAEVNAFNCTAVDGILTISGDDITNLSALAALKSVGIGLEIHGNPNLINLDGLSALKSLGGPGNI